MKALITGASSGMGRVFAHIIPSSWASSVVYKMQTKKIIKEAKNLK